MDCLFNGLSFMCLLHGCYAGVVAGAVARGQGTSGYGYMFLRYEGDGVRAVTRRSPVLFELLGQIYSKVLCRCIALQYIPPKSRLISVG